MRLVDCMPDPPFRSPNQSIIASRDGFGPFRRRTYCDTGNPCIHRFALNAPGIRRHAASIGEQFTEGSVPKGIDYGELPPSRGCKAEGVELSICAWVNRQYGRSLARRKPANHRGKNVRIPGVRGAVKGCHCILTGFESERPSDVGASTLAILSKEIPPDVANELNPARDILLV